MHIKKEASGAQKKPNVKASNERALTADILNRILEKKEFSHLVLREALEHSSLDERSKAFITRLTEGTIEYTIQIDFILNHYCSTKTKNMHPVIRTILRMSVYQ
ncbi:MAG TPA: 16S rRNA (cytosine(967)-C(5))-methyltransferase, partial [Oribacterium sp.]|nr:16S rRNA (cytosine(967)-C(5))-methyltransferase [Oribacterium sp.]